MLEQKNDEPVEQRSVVLSKFNILSKVMSALIETDILSPYISTRNEKNPIDFPYAEGRHLDAWARILNIQAPCSAVIQTVDTLYVSFNKVEKVQNERALEFFNYAISTNIPKYILCTALIFNISSPSNFTKKFRGMATYASKQNKITEFLQSNADKIIDQAETDAVEMLHKLNRDIAKLFDNGHLNSNINIKILDNEYGMHAELVVGQYLRNIFMDDQKEQAFTRNYIGISKLCCYICDQVLNYLAIDHRGTHGKLYLNKYCFPENLDLQCITQIISNIEAYRTKQWLDANARIAEHNLLFYEDRLPEAVYASDDEYGNPVPLNSISLTGGLINLSGEVNTISFTDNI